MLGSGYLASSKKHNVPSEDVPLLYRSAAHICTTEHELKIFSLESLKFSMKLNDNFPKVNGTVCRLLSPETYKDLVFLLVDHSFGDDMLFYYVHVYN